MNGWPLPGFPVPTCRAATPRAPARAASPSTARPSRTSWTAGWCTRAAACCPWRTRGRTPTARSSSSPSRWGRQRKRDTRTPPELPLATHAAASMHCAAHPLRVHDRLSLACMRVAFTMRCVHSWHVALHQHAPNGAPARQRELHACSSLPCRPPSSRPAFPTVLPAPGLQAQRVRARGGRAGGAERHGKGGHRPGRQAHHTHHHHRWERAGPA